MPTFKLYQNGKEVDNVVGVDIDGLKVSRFVVPQLRYLINLAEIDCGI